MTVHKGLKLAPAAGAENSAIPPRAACEKMLRSMGVKDEDNPYWGHFTPISMRSEIDQAEWFAKTAKKIRSGEAENAEMD